MNKNFDFRFSFQPLPPPGAVAVTVEEGIQDLLKTLDACGGKCLDSLANLAGLYQGGGEFDKASECLQRFIELTDDPEEIGAGHLALGQVEESRGDYAAAARRYREALALEPCSTRTWYFIHNNLGYSLNQIGEYSSAIPYLERALEIDPDRPNAYKNLGLAYEALGELEKAAELFITATQVNAADARSLQHLITLVDANPALEVDIPNLRERIEACEKAVEAARKHKPDWDKYWDQLRAEQKRKWWQFWRREERDYISLFSEHPELVTESMFASILRQVALCLSTIALGVFIWFRISVFTPAFRFAAGVVFVVFFALLTLCMIWAEILLHRARKQYREREAKKSSNPYEGSRAAGAN